MDTDVLDKLSPAHADESGDQTPDQGMQIPYPASNVLAVTNAEWTKQNTRRVALIKKRVQQSLTSEEQGELERLRFKMSRQLNAAHPLPFDVLDKLEEYVDQAERRLVERD